MNADLVRVGDVIIGTDSRAMRVLDVQHLYDRDGERSFDVRQILITLIAMEPPDACEETEIVTETTHPEGAGPQETGAD